MARSQLESGVWRASNYTDTFMGVAPDTSARSGVVPSPSSRGPTVASATFELVAENPYGFRSSEVIFTVWADRHGIAEDERDEARVEFFAKPRACLRSSDLGNGSGGGSTPTSNGRIALYAVGSPEYEALAAGLAPDGRRVTVKTAMRSRRR